MLILGFLFWVYSVFVSKQNPKVLWDVYVCVCCMFACLCVCICLYVCICMFVSARACVGGGVRFFMCSVLFCFGSSVLSMAFLRSALLNSLIAIFCNSTTASPKPGMKKEEGKKRYWKKSKSVFF